MRKGTLLTILIGGLAVAALIPSCRLTALACLAVILAVIVSAFVALFVPCVLAAAAWHMYHRDKFEQATLAARLAVRFSPAGNTVTRILGMPPGFCPGQLATDTLSGILRLTGKYAEALAIDKASLNLLSKAGDYAGAAAKAAGLANAYNNAGDFSAAANVVDRAIVVLRRACEQQDADAAAEASPDTRSGAPDLRNYYNYHLAQALNARANVYDTLKQHDQSLPLREEALNIVKALTNNVDVTPYMTALAYTLGKSGQSEKAIELLKDRISACTSKSAIEEKLLLAAQQTLAEVYLDKGDIELAAQYAEVAYQSLPSAPSAGHADPPLYVEIAETMGAIRVRQGRLAEGETILQKVLADSERLFGNQHPQLIVTLKYLAEAFDAAGNHEAALAARQRASQICQLHGMKITIDGQGQI
jgi:tetratricopeptide (TPR) repeat protein